MLIIPTMITWRLDINKVTFISDAITKLDTKKVDKIIEQILKFHLTPSIKLITKAQKRFTRDLGPLMNFGSSEPT